MIGSIATVGVSDHGGWAMLVTVAAPLTVIDRCRVELKDDALPGLPHHAASRNLAIDEAVALVETVRRSAASFAERALAELEGRLARRPSAIALRRLPDLPASVAERIANPWANARADGVLFREQLAAAARARGWSVSWADADRLRAVTETAAYVRAEAAAARRFAPPWNKDCRLALAAAMTAASTEEKRQ